MSKIIAVAVVGAVAFSGFLVWAAVEDWKQWEKFSTEHNCVVVEKRRAQSNTGVGIMTNGQVGVLTSTTSAQTAWKCDDGVTYWR